MSPLARIAALSLLGWAVGWAGCASGTESAVDCESFEAADFETDPENCGECGRTCVVPNATAACVQSDCAIASCDVGFADDDGDPENGCEADDGMVIDNSCTTSCGSTGTVDPADDTMCIAPAETCNGADDNCDGVCDEGRDAGCRVPVHRSFGTGHLFTTDLAAAQTAPFSLEAQAYFYIYADPSPATVTTVLCRKTDGRHLVTTDNNCEGVGTVVLTMGGWANAQNCDAVPLHRLYHEPTNNHFYTISAPERDNAVNNLGYISEGVAGYVWTAP